MRPYDPAAAWRVALLASLGLWVASTLAGTTRVVFTEAPATAAQLADPLWWLLQGLALGVILLGYGWIWPAMTLVFDRPRRPAVQLLFGLLWGSGTGLWLATLYRLVASTGWPRWGVGLAAFGVIALWQALWQSHFWGVYVMPEHDTPATNRFKVLTVHIPNALVTVAVLAITGNVALYALLQTVALVLGSLAMRMPPWWERRPILPSSRRPGLFGLPRYAGWTGPLPERGTGRWVR